MEATDAGQEGLRAGERRMSNGDAAETMEVFGMSDVKAQIAQEALAVVNGTRRQAYGKPEQNFDRIAAFWMTYFRAKGWTIAEVHTGEGPNGTLDVQLHSFDNKILPRDVAAMMRLVKEARLAESPTHRDSYVDLVGYSLCGAEAAGLKSEAVEADASRLIEPEVVKPREFKVGDKLRWLGSFNSSMYTPDSVYTVRSARPDGVFGLTDDDQDTGAHAWPVEHLRAYFAPVD